MIPGDKPAVRKPHLEQAWSLGWCVACGPWELVSHQDLAHSTENRAACDQSCWMILVHACRWSKAVGAVESVSCITSKPSLCVQPAFATVKAGGFAVIFWKALCDQINCSCYRNMKAFVWGSWDQREELVLCSMISSPTAPAVNTRDILKHQHNPAKGTTSKSVLLYTLLLVKCCYLLPTCSQIFQSCRWFLLGEETDDEFGYFLNAVLLFTDL